jgi:tetratricopeptide (TPR) repeat protein
MRKLVLLLVLAFASPVAFARAGGDDAEVTRMAKEHYKAGLDAYNSGNYTQAIKELKKAYLLKRLPPLLLNIAATYRKMGDNDSAITYYQKYLTEAPDAKDHADVEKTVAELQAGGAKPTAVAADDKASAPPADAPPSAPAEAAPVASAQPFQHTPVDAAPPDTPVDVRVTMPVQKGVKVYLYYREPGAAEFSSVIMKRKGPDKIGRVPANVTNGTSFQYYIEAKNADGNVVNHAGSPSEPNIVQIDPNAKPVMVADGEAAAPAAGGEGGGQASRAELDDEAAPIMGNVDEGPRRGHGKAKSGGKRIGGAFYAGLVFAVAGVALVASGGWALGQAQSYANALSLDSQGNNGMPYKFNDPMASPYDDRTVEQRGRSYNTMGIGLTVAGGVALAAGVVMIAVDQTVMAKRRAAAEKPKRTAWYVAPSVGPSFAGAGGGFSF